jgi:CheY-like chemotaxis protein
MTVLSVDDDSDDLELISEALKDIDSTIVCVKATDARQALEFLNSDLEPPDYIFLDINMPIMDGKMCLQEIKKNSRLHSSKVIMISTSANPIDIYYCAQLGADFIVKPPSYTLLVNSLMKTLAKASA